MQTAFDFLSKYKGPIIQLSRSIEDIKVELDQDTNRAQLGESVHDIWNRRKPLYEKISRYEFNIAQGEKEWARIELDLLKFARRILKPQEWHNFLLDQLQHPTFFLSLTFPNIQEAVTLLEKATEGVQAIELRVDLLSNHSLDFVKEQVSLLRRKTALPIIFTVRSKGQGGGFTGSVQQMFDLLQLAVRIGCEFIDMEVAWDSIHKNHLLKNKGVSKIIGSHHDFSTDFSITDSSLKQLFNKCLFNDKIDVLKVVVMARRVDDCYTMQHVLKHLEEQRAKSEMKNVIGLIGLCAGDSGKLSRVMNRFMTPVTHPALPFKAAPGQLSVEEILLLRKQLGIEFKGTDR
jgi:pentafunctional AROM polypeptide